MDAHTLTLATAPAGGDLAVYPLSNGGGVCLRAVR